MRTRNERGVQTNVLTAWLRALGLTLGALSSVTIGGCQPAITDPTLRVAGDPRPAIVRVSGIQHGQPVSFGSIILCLERPGSATVVQVELVEPRGGIHVAAFAVRPNPYPRGEPAIGVERADLPSMGLDVSAQQIVDSACPDPDTVETWQGGSELAFQVAYDAAAAGSAAAVRVTYTVASGRARSFEIPYGVQVCPDTCLDPLASPSVDPPPASGAGTGMTQAAAARLSGH